MLLVHSLSGRQKARGGAQQMAGNNILKTGGTRGLKGSNPQGEMEKREDRKLNNIPPKLN